MPSLIKFFDAVGRRLKTVRYPSILFTTMCQRLNLFWQHYVRLGHFGNIVYNHQKVSHYLLFKTLLSWLFPVIHRPSPKASTHTEKLVTPSKSLESVQYSNFAACPGCNVSELLRAVIAECRISPFSFLNLITT